MLTRTNALTLALVGFVTQVVPALAHAEDDIGVAQEEIIGGANATSSVIGALVGGTGNCTAFLITSRAAVTAAHCVDRVNPRDLSLCFGRRPDVGESVMGCMAVRSFEADSAYTSGLGEASAVHDVAILELASASSAPYFGVRERDITHAETRVAPGVRVDIFGYGLTTIGRTNLTLHTANVGVGRINASGSIVLTDNLDAAGRNWGAPCMGDSGGPVIDRDGNAAGVLAQTDTSSCEHGGYAAPLRAAMPGLICPFLQRARDADGASLCGYPLASSDPGQGGGCRAVPGSTSRWSIAGLAIAIAALATRRNRRA